jgi:1-aminocyclopropane-1-carboxylate deaminase/D-cysteine desulfhydrase-like pyridoxal-dependent ACC family enzyme
MIDYKPVIHTINYRDCEMGVLRLDLVDHGISGNKWFKLKYNLQSAIAQGRDTIITFGGAYSNHIAATASACRAFGLKSIGIIRGEQAAAMNSTLQKASENGMEIEFVSRDIYKTKREEHFLNGLTRRYPNAYIIPEGGDNALGITGCKEILTGETAGYSAICCAIGTGTMFTGLSRSLLPHQRVIGFPVLKGAIKLRSLQAEIFPDYHFGGYAKHTSELLAFKRGFENAYRIPLDYVYTAKLFYGVVDLIHRDVLHHKSKILVIHSGGLQGNEGYEARYSLKPNRQLMDPQG